MKKIILYSLFLFSVFLIINMAYSVFALKVIQPYPVGTIITTGGGGGNNSLLLDQSVPQTVSGGKPYFSAGLKASTLYADYLEDITAGGPTRYDLLNNWIYDGHPGDNNIFLDVYNRYLYDSTGQIVYDAENNKIYKSGDSLTHYDFNDGNFYQNDDIVFSVSPIGFPILGDGILRQDGGAISIDGNTYLTSGDTLLLDQTIPQTVENGTPTFNDGINVNANCLTIGDVQSANRQQIDDAGASLIAYGYYYTFDIYAYNTDGINTVYSTNAYMRDFSDDGLNNNFYIYIDWPEVPGADGYRVIITNDDFNGIYGDNGFDVDTNMFFYGLNDSAEGVTDVSTKPPICDGLSINALGDAVIDGGLNVSGTAYLDGSNWLGDNTAQDIQRLEGFTRVDAYFSCDGGDPFSVYTSTGSKRFTIDDGLTCDEAGAVRVGYFGDYCQSNLCSGGGFAFNNPNTALTLMAGINSWSLGNTYSGALNFYAKRRNASAYDNPLYITAQGNIFNSPSLKANNPSASLFPISSNDFYAYNTSLVNTMFRQVTNGLANLTEWQNSSGSIGTSISQDGKLLTATNILASGNVSYKNPSGMFSSTEIQTISATGTPINVTFNYTEDSYLINKQGNVNFTVNQSGTYLIELSAIAELTIAPINKHFEIWVQKTNSSGSFVNVPRSNTITEFTSAGAEYVIAVPFLMDLTPSEKFRIMMAGDSTNIRLLYTTNTSYSPETPSIIMTISKVSEIT